ncbi:hypothetical protein B0H63DRAFT_393006 [Podospora didyma]|uniref:Endoplasmic reticulum lectin n=1 Tax=Podospora didyma TaxID=330526 RepID=A0AAE0U0V0_9PEZI|nr:hypothetical protein B0H63DRAFT_393006 [Podospora didyma]
MRRFNLVLLASLQLCSARQPGFSIHDDLLAHPQFEVVFSDTYISESEALALLEAPVAPHATYGGGSSSQTDLARNVRESTAAEAAASRQNDDASDFSDNSRQVSETYEIITTPPSRYLCSVPVIAPAPALNQTATELAKAEEARELSRASAKGWELLSGLDGHCLFFGFGWWSYSFCYGRDVVQFHALPATAKGGPPVRDPHSDEYVLGMDAAAALPAKTGAEKAKGIVPANTELQVKDDQRYLVQRLGAGTVCDLTGRPRTIEVQYHCDPATSVDHIAWIKEVTTCTYLMLVQTPRLCADVAFMPPKETRAHPISCQPIISSDEEAAAWLYQKQQLHQDQQQAAAGKVAKDAAAAAANPFSGMTIGGIVVGARRTLGSGEDGAPLAKMPAARQFTGKTATAGETVVIERVITPKKDNVAKPGTREELEELHQRLQDLMADTGYQIEFVEVNDAAEAEDEAVAGGGGQAKRKGDGAGKNGKGNGNGRSGAGGGARQDEEDDSEGEGSEEVFFKDEL